MIKIKEPPVLLEKLNNLIKIYDNFIIKLITEGTEGYYRKFYIPKRSGGYRIIESPEQDTLMILLKKLNYIFSTELTFPESVIGFIKTKSIITNARIHLGAELIINIDLKDFFHSIKKNNISEALHSTPFNFSYEFANKLAAIATKGNYLPQGSPLSPMISNIVANKLDKSLSQLCLQKNIRYSRYADDMTFSIIDGRIDEEDILEIRKEIELSGFQFNEKKYKIKRKNRCLTVTGIIVNKRLNVKRTYIKNIKAALHNLKTTDPNSARINLNSLRGKIEYLGMVRGKDDHIYKSFLDKFNFLINKSEAIESVKQKNIPISADEFDDLINKYNAS